MGAAAAERILPGPEPAYAAPTHVSFVTVGGEPVLFDARRQQMLRLNDSAEAIWRGLAAGATEAEIAASPPVVESAARAWVAEGLLLPAEVDRLLAGPPHARRALRIDELAAELCFFGAAEPTTCDAVFSQFHDPQGRRSVRLSVVEVNDHVFVFRDGRLQAVGEPESLVALVKAELTDLYCQCVANAFLVHGAWLTQGARALLLTGAPGAGKTTLTLALAASGWTYGGDDIVRFNPDGTARGVPFAAAVKSGAWPLLADRWPGLAESPVWRRSDGQVVRYLRPHPLGGSAPARPLTSFVVLAREPGAAAQLQPITPLQALTTLIESAYAANWRLTPEALATLAERLEGAACRRFVYSDLDEAVAALEGLSNA